MANAYLPGGSPAVGSGLPGMPQRTAAASSVSAAVATFGIKITAIGTFSNDLYDPVSMTESDNCLWVNAGTVSSGGGTFLVTRCLKSAIVEGASVAGTSVSAPSDSAQRLVGFGINCFSFVNNGGNLRIYKMTESATTTTTIDTGVALNPAIVVQHHIQKNLVLVVGSNASSAPTATVYDLSSGTPVAVTAAFALPTVSGYGIASPFRAVGFDGDATDVFIAIYKQTGSGNLGHKLVRSTAAGVGTELATVDGTFSYVSSPDVFNGYPLNGCVLHHEYNSSNFNEQTFSGSSAAGLVPISGYVGTSATNLQLLVTAGFGNIGRIGKKAFFGDCSNAGSFNRLNATSVTGAPKFIAGRGLAAVSQGGGILAAQCIPCDVPIKNPSASAAVAGMSVTSSDGITGYIMWNYETGGGTRVGKLTISGAA